MRRFSDLSFIQQIDKPRFLVPLLMPYAAYLRRRGVDVATLSNTDEHDRQLLAVLLATDEEMPIDLVDTLHRLDDLSDDAGHDLILAELERNEIPRRGILASLIGEDLSPIEFAIAVHCRYPQQVRDAHDHLGHRRDGFYEEYQGISDTPITFAQARAKAAGLEYLVGHWFAAKNRSSACRVVVYEERDQLWWAITHGRPYRTIGTVHSALERSRIGYRPQQRDTVIFDPRSCVLKVSAKADGERDLYRQAFGMVFFEDENHFPVRDIYSLEPLRFGPVSLVTVAGVESARVIELGMQLNDEHGIVQVSQGHDLLAPGGPWETARLARGRIVRASFLLTYGSGGQPRELEIRPPNIALYDRARDAEITEAFLLANGFLTRTLR